MEDTSLYQILLHREEIKMRVFLTGATGFIGSRVLPLLIAAGHEVVGLTRSDEGERRLTAMGAYAHRGTLEDLDSLREGVAKADAVIHTAFDHNFENFIANCEKDRQVIMAMGEALSGKGPLIITSGITMGEVRSGTSATEDVFNIDSPTPRKLSEIAAQNLIDRGYDVRIVRLPQVHNTQKQGLISPYINTALAQGVVRYIGDGSNRWSAAHVDDVAKVFALTLEQGVAGQRYHAVAEEGVMARDVAQAISQRFELPIESITVEEVEKEFGWLSMFVGADLSASNVLTCERLHWTPQGRSLVDNIMMMDGV